MDANVTGGDRRGMAWPTMRAEAATRVGGAGSRPSLRSSCSGLILSLIDATSDPRVALKISRRALSAELCRLAAAKRIPPHSPPKPFRGGKQVRRPPSEIGPYVDDPITAVL